MKKVQILILIMTVILPMQSMGQEGEGKDIYKVNWKIEAPLTLGLATGNYFGYRYLSNKDSSALEDVLALNQDNVSNFNSITITPFDEKYATYSDYIFISSFAYGFLLFLDKEIRHEWTDVTLMYLEVLGIKGGGYFLAAGAVDKFRPYVYDEGTSMAKRLSPGGRNSFYGGHPGLTAATTFFAAKVYSDYHPESNFKYAMYGIAGAATLGNAYFRGKAGMHFTSDFIIGITWGTAVGLLVPHLHKKKDSKMSILPFTGNYSGLSLTYRLE